MLLLAFPLESVVHAQDQRVPSRQVIIRDEPIPNDTTRFDISFPGGTAAELIKALSTSSGEPINAMIPEGSDYFVMPPFDFRNVTVTEVLKTLAERKALPVKTSDNSYHYKDVGYSWVLFNGIWVLRIDLPVANLPQQTSVVPFNVGDLLTTYTIDDVTTAIDAAWTLQEASPKSQLFFHNDTSILLAKGSVTELNAVTAVLEKLRDGQEYQVEIQEKERRIDVTVFKSSGSRDYYSLPPNAFITDAQDAAGQFTSVPSEDYNRSVRIIREKISGETEEMVIDVDAIALKKAPDVRLRNGDVIIFEYEYIDPDKIPDPDTISISVLGSVKNPGKYTLEGSPSLISAIALAGGGEDHGNLSKVKVRSENGSTIEVDFNGILDGKVKDLELKDGDTIVIEEKFVRF